MANPSLCRIDRIWIDDQGRLWVRPDLRPTDDFAFIYRAAPEVAWAEDQRALWTPPPRETNYPTRFRFIRDAVLGEYGRMLIPDDDTRWENVPKVVRDEILGAEMPAA